MEFTQLLQLIDQASKSELTSFQYEDADSKIHMEWEPKPAAASEPGSAPAFIRNRDAMSEESIAQALPEERGKLVKSPLVGTFYAAPSDDAPPFVKKGDKVKKGQVLAIVEAMKLMNEIESDFDGEIAEIFVENGEAVDYGKPLFRIE